MARKEGKVKGLTGAQAMTQELAYLTGTNMGAEYLADQARKPNLGQKTAPSHTQLIEYLAEEGRSLYPSESDANKANEILLDAIAKHLKRTGQTVTNKAGATKVLTKEKQAMAGATEGLKNSTKYVAKQMLSRLQSQSTTSGSSAEKVGAQYARQRQSQYNVNESVIYVASGQLANAIASGKVKVYLEGANVGALLKNIE